MIKVALCPSQDGYSVQTGLDVMIQETEGGNNRYRKVFKKSSHSVNLAWKTDAKGYSYLMAFYQHWQNVEDEYFLADLIIDSGDLQEYRCNFTSSLSLNSVQGHLYQSSITLEARASNRNADDDEVIAEFWDIFNPLNILANKALPDGLGGLEVNG